MVACGLLALLLAGSNVLLGRLVSRSALLDEVRIPVWQSTFEMVADRPWFGVGLDGFRFVYPRYMRVEAWTEPLLYHPHNMWLDAAVRMGLPGLAVFAALVALCLYSAVRWSSRSRGLQKAVAVGCLASLLAALAHGMVDSGYFLADLAWSWGLIAGIIAQASPKACSPCGRLRGTLSAAKVDRELSER
jgi:O-antigen ligase